MTGMWRPQSTGNPAVDRQLSMMADMINAALSQVKTLSGSKSQGVTLDQVKALVDPTKLVHQFEAGGTAPMNLTALPGVTGDAQIAGIPILSAIPTANDPHFINTAAVVVGGQLYVNFNGTFTGTTVGLTSVGVAMPAEFSVAGSPLVSNGTITISKAVQVKNTIYAGPTSGANAAPTFRVLVVADLPANLSGLGTAKVSAGNGDPNGAVTGSVGDLFLRQDGGTATTLYVKESGSATNTGWAAK